MDELQRRQGVSFGNRWSPFAGASVQPQVSRATRAQPRWVGSWFAAGVAVGTFLAFPTALAVGGTGQIKAWSGASFILKPVKWYNGSAFVTKPLKRWTGSVWVTTQ